jgi:hypothetical protein
MSGITVISAVYGALAGGNENSAQAANVMSPLQNCINSMDAIVNINNQNMGGDPCPNYTKHFGAIINRDGGTYYYACQEGQTVDFQHGGTPATT